MAVDFSTDRWNRIREDYAAWWSGKLDRPLIQVYLGGGRPDRPQPDIPAYSSVSFYDFSVPAEAIVDRWEYDLSLFAFLGDAFPYVTPVFGPGVMAAFLGATLENSPNTNTVWFHPKKDQEISDIHFAYDADNVWLRRVKALCRAAAARWGGLVQVAMTDLGAPLDTISTFRPGEKLVFDLLNNPGEVRRLVWDCHRLWFRYFDEIDSILRPVNPGYGSWAGIFSETPHYMLQCDFCCMIGPEMFDEFVRGELEAACKRLANPFFHLDGPDALVHLDALCEMDDLKGIQWVPGAGQEAPLAWVHVYRRILDSGKLLQLIDVDNINTTFDTIDALVNKLGSGKGIIARVEAGRSEEAKIRKRMERYGIV